MQFLFGKNEHFSRITAEEGCWGRSKKCTLAWINWFAQEGSRTKQEGSLLQISRFTRALRVRPRIEKCRGRPKSEVERAIKGSGKQQVRNKYPSHETGNASEWERKVIKVQSRKSPFGWIIEAKSGSYPATNRWKSWACKIRGKKADGSPIKDNRGTVLRVERSKRSLQGASIEKQLIGREKEHRNKDDGGNDAKRKRNQAQSNQDRSWAGNFRKRKSRKATGRSWEGVWEEAVDNRRCKTRGAEITGRKSPLAWKGEQGKGWRVGMDPEGKEGTLVRTAGCPSWK